MLVFLLVLLLAGLAGFGYWAYSQGYLKNILKFGSDNTTRTSQGVKDTTPPVISGVEVSSKAIKEVGILWKTDKPSSTQVEWGPKGSFGNKTEIKDDPVTDKTTAGVVTHGVIIKGLTGNTEYQYRALSHTTGSVDAVSDTNTVTTPSE